MCFLSGQRAVLGDQVRWIDVPGEGGKLVAVQPRVTALRRSDPRGKEQLLAANLRGLVVVCSVVAPAFRAGLLDRYAVAAASEGLDLLVVVNKIDLGLPDDVAAALALRAQEGIEIVRVSAKQQHGLDALAARLRELTEAGPWAFVGGSGVGKTSLIAKLLPDVDVGAVGDVSEFWGTGRHTTTRSVLFGLPGGGEIADSPGIRNFTPAGLDSATVRRHFPGLETLQCRYRDCLHRVDEDGCIAQEQAQPELLASYRVLLEEVLKIEAKQRP